MDGTYSPLIRRFSDIEGLQESYTLVYALEVGDSSMECRLSVCRTGAKPCAESLRMSTAPEKCYRMLRFMYENAVQPELWRDVVAELDAQLSASERNGMPCG